MEQCDAVRLSRAGWQKARLVVADDTAIFRRALVRQLQVLGMEALGVGTPEELQRCLGEDPPDAVLLDWHFGGRTAESVLDLLRARWIPVIVLTGNPEGIGATGVPVLGKPVDLELLRVQLAAVLAGSGSTSAGEGRGRADGSRPRDA